MPYKKEKFSIVQDNMVSAIDIDDSVGRSVPINMNFIENGYLSKDTGFSLLGATETTAIHSPYNFEKKNGTSYFIRAKETYIQLFNTGTGLWANTTKTITADKSFGYITDSAGDIMYAGNGVDCAWSYDGTTFTDVTGIPRGNIFEIFEDKLYVAGVLSGVDYVGAATITIAAPGVVTSVGHKLVNGSKISFQTTGTLPTGITAGTTYFVISAGLTADAFEFSTTLNGSAVTTTGSSVDPHTLFKAETLQPRSVYYSNSGKLTTFTGTDVFQPLGTDSITGLENYYGFLIVFKEQSIWKVTRVQDTLGTYYNKQELQSGTYGACSRNAIAWVELDLWFYTGREVRSFGFKDQVTGVLGVNTSVISEPIKETCYLVPEANYPYVACWYCNRRFYLAVTTNLSTPTINDTVFVCHTLYSNAWTKYIGRDKGKTSQFYSIGIVMYSIKNVTPFVVLKWSDILLNDNGAAINGIVTFKKIEDKDFNLFNIYRYLDLMFKNLVGNITITLFQDKSDQRTSQTKSFEIGQV